jgi:hypothetical protein
VTRVHTAALDAWLSRRDPAPPARLAECLRAVLAREGPRTDQAEDTDCSAALPEPGAVADVFIDASAGMVRRLLREGGTDRESALELLAADALATYAFEAAADEPALLEGRCRAAMRHFAEVVDDA